MMKYSYISVTDILFMKMNSSQGRIRKVKSKKNKIDIPTYEIIRCLCLKQDIAADKLGVSISTLKRRYYELKLGRWPIDSSHQPDSPCSKNKEDVSFVLNKFNEDEIYIDANTCRILRIVFSIPSNSSA